jgi:predicted phosphoribosyltransferase
MQIVQTVPVIVGEAVAAGLIVAFVTFVTKKLFKSGRQDVGLAVVGDNGENATNSPIAFGATVHRSIVYNSQNGAEVEKQLQRESGPPQLL